MAHGFRIRQAVVPDRGLEVGVTPAKDDITNAQMQSDNSIIDSAYIDKFTTLSKYRDERYQSFETMLTDPIVSAALEMYADDATQYNRDGNIIWVESDSSVIADWGNRLLNVLDIQSNAWRHIYSLCTYGDLYLRLYKEGDTPDTLDYSAVSNNTMQIIPEDTTRLLEERVEYVSNPATVFDLQEKDKTAGFIKLKSYINSDNNYIEHSIFGNSFSSAVSRISGRDCELLYNKAYIHILLSESVNRSPEYISVSSDDGDGKDTIYKIKSGKSILEDAYPATRTLDLLEDSLVTNRLSKSAIIRLLQIEIGDMPSPEGESVLRRVKNLIEQKVAMNTTNGQMRSYNSPGPVENIIYVPTRGGKGSVTADTIGGDVDVKSIVDIDYFQNLKLAALKIPKQYLNFDSAEGFSNGTSLTKVSSRYAHTIMRIQTAYIRGITNLLNIFAMDKGLDYVNKFKVRMVSPSTVEDSERDEQLNDRINQTRDILDLTDIAEVTQGTKNKVLVKLLKDFVNVPDVADLVSKDLEQQDTDEEDEANIDSDNSDIANDFDDFDSSFNTDSDEEEYIPGPSPEMTEPPAENETPEEPESNTEET
nr:MAG TPA: capsid assembly protein [Bacteriophage sp.]